MWIFIDFMIWNAFEMPTLLCNEVCVFGFERSKKSNHVIFLRSRDLLLTVNNTSFLHWVFVPYVTAVCKIVGARARFTKSCQKHANKDWILSHPILVQFVWFLVRWKEKNWRYFVGLLTGQKDRWGKFWKMTPSRERLILSKRLADSNWILFLNYCLYYISSSSKTIATLCDCGFMKNMKCASEDQSSNAASIAIFYENVVA